MRNTRRGFLQQGLAAMAVAGLGACALAQEAMLYVCPMHPDVTSKVAGKCPKCQMKLVAAPATSTDDFYVCPMHPDVTSNKPDVCPKCKMKLVKGAPPELGEYTVRMETTPAMPKVGEPVKLRFAIFHPITEKQITEFNILHDMPFHLFVVSQDFTEFQHIHPERHSDGSFTIETVLPRAGYYKVFCDFFPGGGSPQVIHRSLVTAGYQGDVLSSEARLVPDKTLTKELHGVRFELKLEPATPFAGKPAELRYHLVDAASNEPVKDLQPYLGAWGHTLILSEDATDYLHSHPAQMLSEDLAEAERARLRGGPDVTFDTFFPRPGNYRIWSQFKRGAQIITVPFTVYVPRMQ